MLISNDLCDKLQTNLHNEHGTCKREEERCDILAWGAWCSGSVVLTPCFAFLLDMLQGTSGGRQTCGGTCTANRLLYLDQTWGGPGERGVRGGADSGREPGGVREPKRRYLRALECQHGCSHLSLRTDPGPSALWHDFSL